MCVCVGGGGGKKFVSQVLPYEKKKKNTRQKIQTGSTLVESSSTYLNV